jgi:hypothetical protein
VTSLLFRLFAPAQPPDATIHPLPGCTRSWLSDRGVAPETAQSSNSIQTTAPFPCLASHPPPALAFSHQPTTAGTGPLHQTDARLPCKPGTKKDPMSDLTFSPHFSLILSCHPDCGLKREGIHAIHTLRTVRAPLCQTRLVSGWRAINQSIDRSAPPRSSVKSDSLHAIHPLPACLPACLPPTGQLQLSSA